MTAGMLLEIRLVTLPSFPQHGTNEMCYNFRMRLLVGIGC